MVPIPVALWELIRRYQALDFGLLEKSDAELEALVEREVDARLAMTKGPARRISDAFKLGDSNLPRDQQIANAMSWYGARQRRLREVKAALEALEQQNPRVDDEPPVVDAEP